VPDPFLGTSQNEFTVKSGKIPKKGRFMNNLLLLFNHELNSEQEADARNRLNVDAFLYPPEDIRALWRQIPTEEVSLGSYLEPVRQWMHQVGKPGDYVLIQGDFGACYIAVQAAFHHGMIPVYATTRREATETRLPDGTVQLTHRFRHAGFRRYELLPPDPP